VYVGMKAACKKVYGNDSLAGKKVLVQGAGNVGRTLIDHIVEEGGKVMVSDINENNIKLVTAKHPEVQVVDNNKVFDLEMDIYAPCALGASVNTESISKMKCAIIAGAANNQLAEEDVHGPMLVTKGITYVPDFLINAGGIINISVELTGYNRNRAIGIVDKIYDRTLENFRLAEKENIHNQLAAMRMAEKRIKDIANLKVSL
ncbi:MAG: leucine dehydrogenase, partial [Taibaiella sp.]|nr:leucine dehydrogenase [Taibaiella sp.]